MTTFTSFVFAHLQCSRSTSGYFLLVRAPVWELLATPSYLYLSQCCRKECSFLRSFLQMGKARHIRWMWPVQEKWKAQEQSPYFSSSNYQLSLKDKKFILCQWKTIHVSRNLWVSALKRGVLFYKAIVIPKTDISTLHF